MSVCVCAPLLGQQARTKCANNVHKCGATF